MKWLTLLALPTEARSCVRLLSHISLACCALSCGAFSQATANRPLTVGIKRNQQELQRISVMIQENKNDQTLLLTEALADATSLVTAGSLKYINDADRVSTLLNIIKNAAGTTGKLTDFADAADDFKNGALGLKVSDSLKELLDLLGSNPALVEIGIVNTINDLGIKAAQWRALQVENDELTKVLARITVAQNQLLAKDPVTQARTKAAADKAIRAAAERQRTQGELLRQYYQDKPRSIELAVRQSVARGLNRGLPVAQGMSIVDPEQSTWQLSAIPGINPDFIAALERCNRTLPLLGTRAGYEASMTCNKYDDGSYIPAFGKEDSSVVTTSDRTLATNSATPNMNTIKDTQPLKTQDVRDKTRTDAPVTGSKPQGAIVSQVAGRTGAIVKAPASVASIIPRGGDNYVDATVFRAPCESRPRSTSNNVGSWTVMYIRSPDSVKANGIGSLQALAPGQYCIGIGASGNGPEFGSNLGFRAIDFRVVAGHAAVITVPMGILEMRGSDVRGHTVCYVLRNSEVDIVKLLRAASGAEPSLRPPLNRFVLPPDEYSYSCQKPLGSDNAKGSFTIRSGQVTTVTIE